MLIQAKNIGVSDFIKSADRYYQVQTVTKALDAKGRERIGVVSIDSHGEYWEAVYFPEWTVEIM